MLNPPNEIIDLCELALALEDLTPDQGLALLTNKHPNSEQVLQKYSDHLRQKLCGETVTYVVNRNINFSNICEQHCNFCAFRRDANDEGAYWLSESTMLAKAAIAVQHGATELCIQGGLNPQAKLAGSSLQFYQRLLQAFKQAFPALHLHAFSPQEIQFIAREDGLSYQAVLQQLQDAGLGSIPGTAAEVLVDRVRQQLCPEKINTNTWLEIVSLAHRLGIPSTSTLMAGHIETAANLIEHLENLRQLQQNSLQHGYPSQITEFILLPFVGQNAPLPLRKRVNRNQPDHQWCLRLTAVARLYLGRWIKNHQPSWVKLGLDGATTALKWGCNDLGGTLMEEHITTMAGAQGGTKLTVAELQAAAHGIGRPTQQRDTLYQPCFPETLLSH